MQARRTWQLAAFAGLGAVVLARPPLRWRARLCALAAGLAVLGAAPRALA